MLNKRLALDGILLALAAAFSFLESLIPLPVGIRLGLSSLVIMYALLFLSKTEAGAIVLLKSCFAMLTRGLTAGMLSFSGGILSLIGMILLLRLRSSLLLMSSIGGFLHNLGQILTASCLMRSTAIFTYFPILAAAGLGAGILSACILRLLLPHLPDAQSIHTPSTFSRKVPDK